MPKSFVYKQLPSNKLAIGKQNIPGFLWSLQGFYGAYKVFYEGWILQSNQSDHCICYK